MTDLVVIFVRVFGLFLVEKIVEVVMLKTDTQVDRVLLAVLAIKTSLEGWRIMWRRPRRRSSMWRLAFVDCRS